VLVSSGYALSSAKLTQYQTSSIEIAHAVSQVEELVAEIMAFLFVNAMPKEKLLFRGESGVPNAIADVGVILERCGKQNAMDYFKRFLLSNSFEDKMKIINEINDNALI